MATPARIVELECPNCQHHHWEIDRDFRGSELVGQRELSYKERAYGCPACKEVTAGYRVLQKSPPEFLLQPHPMYPMTTDDFGHWLSVFRAHFPSHDRLRSVGVFWYPGASDEQTRKLHHARDLGRVQGYRLSLSNQSPDDERIRVCVQGNGEATFWCGSGVELDHCYFGFEAGELEKIRELLAARTSEIRRAWQRFSEEAKEAREKWLPKLLGRNGQSGPHPVTKSHTNAAVSMSLALVPGVLYLLLHDLVNKVAYPPPMYTLFLMLLLSGIPGRAIEMAVGAAVQVVIFGIANSYLLIPRVKTRLLAVWAPSVVAFLIATAFELLTARHAWQRPDYPGARATVFIGVGILGATFAWGAFALRYARHRTTEVVLVFNCLLHCAAVAVLFPYVGELP